MDRQDDRPRSVRPQPVGRNAALDSLARLVYRLLGRVAFELISQGRE